MDSIKLTQLLTQLSDSNKDFSDDIENINSRIGNLNGYYPDIDNEEEVEEHQLLISDIIGSLVSLINNSVAHYRNDILIDLNNLLDVLKIDSFKSKDLYVITEALIDKIKMYTSTFNLFEMITQVGNTQGYHSKLSKCLDNIREKLNYFYLAISRLIKSFEESLNAPTEATSQDDQIKKLTQKISHLETKINNLETGLTNRLINIEKLLNRPK